ncbi:MAG: RNase H family protein [Fervidobacterium sp.]
MVDENVIVYTDGSFKNGLTSCAGIIKSSDSKVIEEFQFALTSKLAIHRNVSGEIISVMYSIYSSFKQGFFCLDIFHDYEGLYKWISGEWNANTKLTKFYVAFVEEYIKKGMNINFIKIKAHHNNSLNNYVDRLAKQAIDKKIMKGFFIDEFLERLKLENLL